MADFLREAGQLFMRHWDGLNISAPFLTLYFVSVYYLYRTKGIKIRTCFVYPVIFYVLIMCNPVTHWVLMNKLGFQSRVHRFSWTLPFTFVLAWAAMEAGAWIRQRWGVGILAGFLAVLLLASGSSMLREEHYKTENIYKVRNDVIEISAMLEEISGKEEKNVFFGNDQLAYMARQYDPSLCLVVEAHLLEKMIDREYQNEGGSLGEIVNYFCLYHGGTASAAYNILVEWGVEFVVLEYEEETLVEMGSLEYLGSTNQFYVYQVL